MRTMVEETECIVSRFSLPGEISATTNNGQRETRNVLVHCWRGGMRSAGVAWLLDLYGFKVYTLAGGYKAYRKWVRKQFEKPHQLSILGGYTGSGKTLVLHQMKEAGFPIIDLEALANHKGSAFGSMGENAQPGQEMFENLLAGALNDVCCSLVAKQTTNDQPTTTNDVFIEDESQRIGDLKIPDSFWKQMRVSNIFFLDIPFEERLNYITAEYGKKEKKQLVNAIIRIQKRLGGLEAKNAINFLLEDNYKECFRILLKYYDKWYSKGLYSRDDAAGLIRKIPGSAVDAKNNADLLMNENGMTLADTDE